MRRTNHNRNMKRGRKNEMCSTSLPLNDINILVITDIHGWIGKQHFRHEPHMNIDIGYVTSFYEQISKCNNNGDWFFLFNGDFMDGTGLSTIPPTILTSLLQQVPFDALNIGNHELYSNQVIDYIAQPGGFIHYWNGTFLTSNVDYIINTQNNQTIHRPLGNRYTVLHGQSSTVLVFGFLYNFNNADSHAHVQPLEETLEHELWLHDALTQETYDAIVVLAHMDAIDPLVYKIYHHLRHVVGPTIPIQFVTGHSHRRYFQTNLNENDPLATSFEAGRFLDTIGFISLPKQSTAIKLLEQSSLSSSSTTATTRLFQHKFLDTNQNVLCHALGLSNGCDFRTPNGQALSNKLAVTQQSLGLETIVTSCAPSQYFPLYAPLNNTKSLWWLYLQQVIPTTLFPRLNNNSYMKHNNDYYIQPIFIQGTGALRYSLWGPRVVMDDIIAVTPFANPIYQVGMNIHNSQLKLLLKALHADQPSKDFEFQNLLPSFGIAGKFYNNNNSNNNNIQSVRYDIYTVEFHLHQMMNELRKILHQDGEELPFFLPRAIYEDESTKHQLLGTTKLWIDFVQTQWKCPSSSEQKGPTKTTKQIINQITTTTHLVVVENQPPLLTMVRTNNNIRPFHSRFKDPMNKSKNLMLVWWVFLCLLATLAITRYQKSRRRFQTIQDNNDDRASASTSCTELTPLL